MQANAHKKFKKAVSSWELPLQKAKLFKSWIAMVKGASDVKLQDFFDAAFGLAQEEGKLEDAIQHYKSTEAGRRAFLQRPRLKSVSIPELLQNPEGSLGRAYGEHLDRAGIDPTAFSDFEATTDHQYVLAYLFETHDLFHVLGGFGTDYEGEIELQGFYAAQSPGRISPMIIAAGLMNCALFEPKQGPGRLGRVTRAFRMGKKTKLIFGTDFNPLWSLPLEDIRRQLQIDLGDADRE